MKNGLGVGLEEKVLVLVLTKNIDIFKTLLNDKNYKPHYKKYKFIPAFCCCGSQAIPAVVQQ